MDWRARGEAERTHHAKLSGLSLGSRKRKGVRIASDGGREINRKRTLAWQNQEKKDKRDEVCT